MILVGNTSRGKANITSLQLFPDVDTWLNGLSHKTISDLHRMPFSLPSIWDIDIGQTPKYYRAPKKRELAAKIAVLHARYHAQEE